jgi:hypothetical protein
MRRTGLLKPHSPRRNLAEPIALTEFAPTGSQPGVRMTVCSETLRAISTLEQFESFTESLLGLLRTPSDAGAGATSAPTGQAARGEGL